MVISVGGGVTTPDWEVETEPPVVPFVACAEPLAASMAKTASEAVAFAVFIVVILCIPLSAAAEASAKCGTGSPAGNVIVSQARA
jgi:hypothetical protein